MTTPTTPKKSLLNRLPRMLDWLIYAIVLASLVWLLAPQQLPVSVYKLSLVALAAVVGYWIDRSLFPYARPDQFLSRYDSECDAAEDAEPNIPEGESIFAVCPDHGLLRIAGVAMMRRAIIVASTMLAVGLGA